MDHERLLQAKRQGLKGSKNRCASCGMQVLENEDDDLCPWCKQKRARDGDTTEGGAR